MRCKQGDLAVVIKTFPWKDKRVIGCLLVCECLLDDMWTFKPVSPFLFTQGFLVKDAHLRPIRPSEGQDETLSWKDVPHKELA